MDEIIDGMNAKEVHHLYRYLHAAEKKFRRAAQDTAAPGLFSAAWEMEDLQEEIVLSLA